MCIYWTLIKASICLTQTNFKTEQYNLECSLCHFQVSCPYPSSHSKYKLISLVYKNGVMHCAVFYAFYCSARLPKVYPCCISSFFITKQNFIELMHHRFFYFPIVVKWILTLIW